MKTRILHTKIWEDEYFYSLDDKEQLMFLYLLTNPNNNLIGIYELGDTKLVTWLKTTKERVSCIKEKFEKDRKFVFYKDWVKVLNHEKYNNYGNGKQEKAVEREISLIPSEAITYFQEFDTSIILPSYYPDTNCKSEIINHKSETINKNNDNHCSRYIEKFNELFGRSYQVTDKRAEKVKERLKKYTFDQLLSALNNLASSPFHKGDNERGWVADPDFLVRNDEQVDKWLNYKAERKGNIRVIRD